MLISIDASSGLAIYDQIVRQIKFAIASEAVLPGELVPSVRELAKQVAVNPNTVARAYRELQAENVLERFVEPACRLRRRLPNAVAQIAWL